MSNRNSRLTNRTESRLCRRLSKGDRETTRQNLRGTAQVRDLICEERNIDRFYIKHNFNRQPSLACNTKWSV